MLKLYERMDLMRKMFVETLYVKYFMFREAGGNQDCILVFSMMKNSDHVSWKLASI